MTVSERLRKAVEAYGSVYRVAKGSGVSQTALNRCVNRERGLSVEATDAMAAFFGMELVEKHTRQKGR